MVRLHGGKQVIGWFTDLYFVKLIATQVSQALVLMKIRNVCCYECPLLSNLPKANTTCSLQLMNAKKRLLDASLTPLLVRYYMNEQVVVLYATGKE